MRAFLCHSSKDSEFVIEVAKHLKRSLDGGVFYFEEHQRSDTSFINVIDKELENCQVTIIFVGESFTDWQVEEATTAINLRINSQEPRHIITVLLPGAEDVPLNLLKRYQVIITEEASPREAYEVAKKIIVEKLNAPWRAADDLPLNPHLFSYEKDIIEYFLEKANRGEALFTIPPESEEDAKKVEWLRKNLLNGCPSEWPEVVYWSGQRRGNPIYEGDIGKHRPLEAKVIAAALSTYHKPPSEQREDNGENSSLPRTCMVHENLCLPEAGPRARLFYPSGNNLRVAILVAGGIAPGINAVIDGITQRHHMYATNRDGTIRYNLRIQGIRDGFHAFFDQDVPPDEWLVKLKPSGASRADEMVTSEHASEGGSMLGTSRVEDLLKPDTRDDALRHIVNGLFDRYIDILYIIGGDGSMKAAHAIWSHAQELARGRRRKLSVVAIPKTMDNDILWVWQTFGFLSAVERARGVIESLATEAISNPRLGVIQLFGSDSGFVVSHAVLASRTGICDAALIPEIDFSMKKLASYLKRKMCEREERIPRGLVVMAETAIPTDAMDYVSDIPEKIEVDKLEQDVLAKIADKDREAIQSLYNKDGSEKYYVLQIDNLDDDSEKRAKDIFEKAAYEYYINIGLSQDEENAIREFEMLRKNQERIEGQTNDHLRTAGLKIVSRGLLKLLPDETIEPDIRLEGDFEPDWEKLRVFTNEPRHLLRAIPPSCSDIIFAHRLGTLAVDNAIAGYTDFMVSQWLTEYVLVPLKLVVLGRKRIPETGIFWKSVLAKTGQPDNLALGR